VTTDWTTEQLEVIGGAEELEIASRRPDGSQREYTPIWVVRIGVTSSCARPEAGPAAGSRTCWKTRRGESVPRESSTT
jgi:hypothetical protein